MLRIMPDEYRTRLQQLKASVEKAGLDLFIVSAFDSIFYLTGAGFEPLERPFFLIIRPSGNPSLLTPMLDRDHLKLAHNISPNNIHSYWEYPAPQGRGWPDQLTDSDRHGKFNRRGAHAKAGNLCRVGKPQASYAAACRRSSVDQDGY